MVRIMFTSQVRNQSSSIKCSLINVSSSTVPKNCQVASTQITIKPVHIIPPSRNEVSKLNMIYKVNENHLVLMEDGSKNMKNKTFSSLAVHSKAILNQINDTRQKLEHAHYQSKFKISGYIPYMIFSTINVGNITSAVKRSIGSTTG